VTTYRDHGEIETITFEDGSELSRRHRFTTLGRGGGSGKRVRLDLTEEGAASGAPGRVLWSEGEGWVFRWEAAGRRWGPEESWLRGMAAALPPATAAALVVPALLAGEEPMLLAGAEAHLEAPRPCGTRECRVLRLEPPEGPGGERLRGRLWIDPETPRVRRVEVELLPPVPEPAVWVRLDLEVDAAADGNPAEPLFLPPPDAVYEESPRPKVAAKQPDLLFDVELVERPSEGAPGAVFEESITVSRTSLPVRVFDRRGEPMRELTPESFRVEVGGSEVPVEAADWIEPGRPWISELSPQEREALEELGVGPGPEGPWVVLFVHSARESFRTLGHLRFRNHLRSLLAALPETARMAVVAYDVRLKLWQDFTRDRERVYETVQRAVYFTAEPETSAPGGEGPGLLDCWDFEAARRTGFAEDALAVLGEALAELPGDKAVVYLGWGLGEAVAGSFRRAAGALVTAGIPLHALDVTPALAPGAGHTLAAGLARMARVTGGTYASTAGGPERAWKRVARGLEGYYLLVLDTGALPTRGGRVEVRVPGDRWTEVRTPSLTFAAAP
jgi:VWFA-related protein